MRRIIFISILLVFSLIQKNSCYAQSLDSLSSLQADISELDTFPEIDSTLIFNEPDIDEDLNDIFSEKMDRLEHTWLIQNVFLNDSAEFKQTENFPKNLPDSVYIDRLFDLQIDRLKNIEQVIDLSYNKVVKNFIQMYTEKKRNLVEVMLGLSEYYFPIFEETLDKYNLPLELKYLPVIESALNPKALSRAGANGLWQFVYSTGKGLKLEITSFVDERRDPVKSTDAAVRYLKSLYDKYGDWQLAIAAYNCGPGNVDKAIRRSGNKTNYWDIYYRLPRETRGYVPAFIAAVYVMNYYKQHNLIPLLPDFQMNTDTIMVNNYLHFDQVSAVLKIDKEELRSLNPMYRRDVIPAKKNNPYPIVLPKDKIMEFIDNNKSVFAYNREKYFPDNTLVQPSANSGYFTPVDIAGKEKIIYTVKSGDNVGYISSWFNVRAADLRYWNNVSRNLIRVGQKLVIYVPEKQKDKYSRVNGMSFAQKQAMIGKSATIETKREVQILDPNYIYYTVKKGDSVWDIAQKYNGISSDEIMLLNNISNEKGLYVGQKLKIKRKS